MKLKLIVSLVVVLVVLTGSSAAVFAHTRTSSHATVPAVFTYVCTETGLTGAALQENKLFCNPNLVAGVTVISPCVITDVDDGSVMYAAAIGAANRHILVGYPTSCGPSVNWGGLPVKDVELSRGNYHGEIGPDGVARIYDHNQQVYP